CGRWTGRRWRPDAGLRLPPWMAEMPVLQEQKPALRPNVRRRISLQSSLARVPAVTRFARPRASLRPLLPPVVALLTKNRQRPRIVRYVLYHDPCPASRRAWLPDFFACGLARMGREKPQQPESFLAACSRKNFLGFGFWVLGFGFWVLGFGFCARSAPNKFCRRSRQGGSCPFVPARSLAKPIASFG